MRRSFAATKTTASCFPLLLPLWSTEILFLNVETFEHWVQRLNSKGGRFRDQSSRCSLTYHSKSCLHTLAVATHFQGVLHRNGLQLIFLLVFQDTRRGYIGGPWELRPEAQKIFDMHVKIWPLLLVARTHHCRPSVRLRSTVQLEKPTTHPPNYVEAVGLDLLKLRLSP